jgi:hypothetical protein
VKSIKVRKKLVIKFIEPIKKMSETLRQFPESEKIVTSILSKEAENIDKSGEYDTSLLDLLSLSSLTNFSKFNIN